MGSSKSLSVEWAERLIATIGVLRLNGVTVGSFLMKVRHPDYDGDMIIEVDIGADFEDMLEKIKINARQLASEKVYQAFPQSPPGWASTPSNPYGVSPPPSNPYQNVGMNQPAAMGQAMGMMGMRNQPYQNYGITITETSRPAAEQQEKEQSAWEAHWKRAVNLLYGRSDDEDDDDAA